MKRNAKQNGSRGRIRLALLLASAAAFLLIPAAAASAFPVQITFAGEGTGWVKGFGSANGEPPIECHWNGSEIDIGVPEPGKCDSNTELVEGFNGIVVDHEEDLGTEFGGWKVEEGTAITCSQENPAAGICSVITFATPIVINATFNLEPEHFKLNLSTSGGSGSGSFKCDTGSGPEACEAEYAEGTEVTVTPEAATGSEFVEFSGDCSGGSCELTMNEDHSVNAQFDLETFAFGLTVIGEGTVECDVNGGGLGACPSSTTYGDEIEVVAEPNSVKFTLGEISGTEDASGCTSSPCSFTIDGPFGSSVTAEFVTAASEASAEVKTVHGEVPETTTLDAEGCEDVDLGEFIPGVEADYPNTCVVVLTSTGAETKFTASDESAEHTGHLVQGSYFLPSALEVKAEDSEAKGTGPGLTPLSPVTLLTFGEPIAKDSTTVTFSQHIGEHDGLHTGEYGKTITLTLAQTA